MNLTPFQFRIQTKIHFGPGAIDGLGDHARGCNGSRAIIVTDEGVRSAGHVDRAVESLERAGIDVTIFDGVRENPTTDDVDRCLSVAGEAGIDLIVGLGGGSSMDCAKGCNFLLTNGGRMQDYWGVGKASKPMLPLIAVPTTTGTGSEMQSFALIADAGTHQKMACGSAFALAQVAVLDPTLAVTQPRDVLACSGLDTIAHAVESSVTTKRNAVSTMFSRESFRLAQTFFPRIVADASDIEAQGAMLLAAAYGGVAIENSMLGAAHSLANPLTARCGLSHGHAVGVMLPHVVRFNAGVEAAASVYRALAEFVGVNGSSSAEESLAARLTELVATSGLAVSLKPCGVDRDLIPELAAMAAEQWTAQFNPRRPTVDDFAALYDDAM